MRGRPKLPANIIELRGKSNISKAELERRKAEELYVPYTNVTPPDYLPEELVDEFNHIAKMLLDLKIMTELDEDTLARYLLSKKQYLELTAQLDKAMAEEDIYTMTKLQNMQDKAFKQCRSGASDLGLTITSRVRLVVPQAAQPPKNKFVEKFGSD